MGKLSAATLGRRRAENAALAAEAEAAFAVKQAARRKTEAAQLAAGAPACAVSGCNHVALKSGKCLGHELL